MSELKLGNRAETGSWYYFTWFVVFFCCSDKMGRRLFSLQQAHALTMTQPERGRGEGLREKIRQPHQRQQVWTVAVSLGPNQMYGKGSRWIMNLGEFRANCADRKKKSMNNSLCRTPDHLPPTSITLFHRHPASLVLITDLCNFSLPFSCNASNHPSSFFSYCSLCFCLNHASSPLSLYPLLSLQNNKKIWCFFRQKNPQGRRRGKGGHVFIYFSPPSFRPASSPPTRLHSWR